jgi:hypothetical protein
MQRKVGVVVTVLVLTAVGVALPATAFAVNSTGSASVQGESITGPSLSCEFAGSYGWSGFANASSATITVDDLTTNMSTTITAPVASGNPITLDVSAAHGDSMAVKGFLSTATGKRIHASIASTPKNGPFFTVGGVAGCF